MRNRLGLVLTSGGARGAYQAGVLQGLAEILPDGPSPFEVLSGVSAGSLNCAFLAAAPGNFRTAAMNLSELWCTIHPPDVFCTDKATLAKTAMGWVTDLGLGGWIGAGRGKSLLRTDPLQLLVETHVDFARIHDNIREGRLHGLALTATHYGTGTSVTFFDAADDVQSWVRTTRISNRTRLHAGHVLASAAIPFFFPAIEIDGAFYGDGCIRMTTPFSPAVHMGADRILAIGVRHERSVRQVSEMNAQLTPLTSTYPSVAQIGGVLLNSMFLDALEGDAERMARINQTVSLIPRPVSGPHPSPLRHIPILVIKPSVDLGELVRDRFESLPSTLRYFFKGLGISGDADGMDLLSYLAFDTAYTSRLNEIGYQDALRMKEEIAAFFS